jgi:hypothetical protein
LAEIHEAQEGSRILDAGTALVTHIVRARVPMPTSARDLINQCDRFRRSYLDSKGQPPPLSPMPG